jgi:hypothetical protein
MPALARARTAPFHLRKCPALAPGVNAVLFCFAQDALGSRGGPDGRPKRFFQDTNRTETSGTLHLLI